jgi:hypothetical protein
VRLGLALLLVDDTLAEWRALAHGFFRDAFNWPILPDALLPSRPLFTLLVAAQAVLALAILVGRGARPSLLAAGLFQLYLLLIDRNGYHNYRHTFALVLMLMAFTPCDRALAWRRPAGDGPLWAQRLLQLQLSIIYLASGGSKLVDADWRGGRVIAAGVTHFADIAVARGVPPAAVAFFMGTTVAALLAKLAIATELGIGLGLWSRRWRAAALWLGVVFHLAIELVTTVAIFSWLMILCYALFATPALAERTVRHPPRQRRLAQLVRGLDWLRRFRFVPGDDFAVIDRDGRVCRGAEALALIARATPLLFLGWPPLWLWARVTRRRARALS